MNKATKVKLLEKPSKDGLKKSLYLDFYPPLTNPQTGLQTRREFLNMWIWDAPKSKEQKDHNRNYNQLAAKIKAKRELDIHAERFDFLVKEKQDKDFLDFFSNQVNEMSEGSTRRGYTAVLKLLESFSKKITYNQLDNKFCERFRKYLIEMVVKQNSAGVYYTKFKAIVNQLVKAKEVPLIDFQSIKVEETQRQYLTIEELQKLIETDCPKPILKQAALFSALTGLRFSDVQKMTWGEVQKKDDGWAIVFRQQKTKYIETMPISDNTLLWCGERQNDNQKVFENLNPQDNKILSKWVKLAGIKKDITFHCFRHTYAVLLINKDLDIYSVSKMLGHRDLKTTQIYAKLTDAKKRSAANLINLNVP